ncbi:MAG: glycine cleavage system protein H [Verrucomicrobiota bacterium]
MEYIRYKHARFSARFPAHYTYSPSHYWMAPDPDQPDLWKVGFTKFATRMLGELVDAEFSLAEGDPVSPGQEIGWVEGFKAASDVLCVMNGSFAGHNPALQVDACIVRSDPYIEGWLYAIKGTPEEQSLDAEGYIKRLDETITRMQAQEEESS